MIYLDNSATSWPKPDCVAEAMVRFLREAGANPGRSGHRMSVQAARVVEETREAVAKILNVADPLRIVFCQNATDALNLALQSILKPGDHVVTSSMEHNSVMRPLRNLERKGVSLSVVPCSREGFLDPGAVEREIRPETAMVVVNHASNVSGTLLPVREAGEVTRRRGVLLLVDAAQTAGAYPIDFESEGIDLLAFTGHKALYGPMGTGGLVLGERVEVEKMEPVRRGGTGSRSEYEEQPDFLPDKFESGTLNAVGLAGLGAGVSWVLERGVESIRKRELELVELMLEGLKEIPGVHIAGPEGAEARVGTVSFTIDGLDPAAVALDLDRAYDVMTRVGLHCAPAAHRTLGTFPAGTVRFSVGAFTTEEEIEKAVSAVESMAQGR